MCQEGCAVLPGMSELHFCVQRAATAAVWRLSSRVGIWSICQPEDLEADGKGVLERFISSQNVRTGSEAHPASCLMGTGDRFYRRQSGRDVTLTAHF